MAKIIINQDKIDNIEEVLQICPFEAMEEVDGKVEINAACKMCKMCVKKGPEGAFIFEDDEVVQINKDGVDIVDNASDGQEFTEDGKYTINVVTKFGKIISKTIISIFSLKILFMQL